MVGFMSNGTASGEVSASGTTMIRPECTVCGCWSEPGWKFACDEGWKCACDEALRRRGGVKCGSEAQGGRLGPGVSHGLGRCRLQVAGEVRVATWPSNTSIYGNALSRAANAGSYRFNFVRARNSLLQIVPLPSWQAVGAQPDVLCWQRSRLTVVAV